MKKLATILFLFIVSINNAQEINPTYKKAGDMVKATYYFEDGTVKEQGFFKDAKLSGKWISYNRSGEKTMVAYYNNGKKVGKWYAINANSIKEISYVGNAVKSVKIVGKKEKSELAYN